MTGCDAKRRRPQWLGSLLLAGPLLAVGFALIAANSRYSRFYDGLVDTQLSLPFLLIPVTHPPLFWINEALMAAAFCWIAWQGRQGWSAMRKGGDQYCSWYSLGAAAVVALVPAALLMVFHGDWSGRWLAAGAADPLLVWLVLVATGGVESRTRNVLVGWLALQNLAVLAASYAMLQGEVIAEAAWFAVGAMVLAAGLAAHRSKGGGAVAVLLLLGAWWSLLRAGLPGSAAAAQLGWLLPGFFAGRTTPQAPSRLGLLFVFCLLGAMLVVNAGISLRGVVPTYVLQTTPLSVLIVLAGVKSILAFPAISWFVLRYAPGASMPAQVRCGLALLCGLGGTGVLYVASLHHDVGNYLFDHRLAVLWGALLLLLPIVALFRLTPR
ncbi:Na+/H+ antiporter NhaA [Spongiibacter taiwanensis]|uniref:Na+/H+ antiporter NhaA n=1 Tax=Spongiibacter taiwanensis TaxID=1748242 RepID=UPI002034DFD4|nr:Na+/H+ antiporter NhaA [Spongiibacter taiwanensis]USA43581.1 Na+/H+ antiporter NhaA [Spongiibacter taiwanensis]